MTHTNEERNELMRVMQDLIKQMDEGRGSDADTDSIVEQIEQVKVWIEEGR